MRALSLGLFLSSTLLSGLTFASISTGIRFDRVDDGRYRCGNLTLEAAGVSFAGVHVRLIGGLGVPPAGEEPAPGRTSYLVGSQAEWRTGLSSFSKTRYRGVYPGIDLVFYGQDGKLEYDFVVAPGADPDRIRLRIEGAKVNLLPSGDLEFGGVTWKRPRLYQGEQTIRGAFVVKGREVAFQVGAYDRHRELVIDPVLNFSTYLGGSGNEAARAIGLDGSGNVYIAGYTTTATLPVSKTAAQAGYGGQTTNLMTGDAFIAKYSPAGALLYLTYLGGSGDDVAGAIAVDPAGNAYVTGFTNSRDFPISAGAAQNYYGGAAGNVVVPMGDAFVAKINPDGSKILYATYFGGAGDELGTGIAIDATGAAYITGTTQSVNLPVTAGVVQSKYQGAGGQPPTDILDAPFWVAGDGFVAKLNPTGTQFNWATYLGGKLDDTPLAIALDKSGYVFVAGSTISTDFPTTAGALQRVFGGSDPQNWFFHLGDGFITKLSPDATKIVFSTYLGKGGDDSITAMTLDSTGAVYVTGTTSSTNFPVTTGAAFKGPYENPLAERVVGDAYLAKLDPAGASLAFATYIGGSNDDGGFGIALAPDGTIYVAGQSASYNFPITVDAAQKTMMGYGEQHNNGDFLGDGFLVQFSADGTRMLYSTFLGGRYDDTAQGVAVDPAGNVFVTGNSMSANFPTLNAAQKTYGGSNFAGRMRGDAFLARFSPPAVESPVKLVSMTNAASNAVGAVSPGMIFVAYGDKMGPTSIVTAALDDSGRLANKLSNTQILFDGVPAPLVYVLDKQISGVVPYSVAGKSTTQVVANYQGQQSAALGIKVTEAVPGLFSTDYSGAGQGAILNQDGTYNSAANPAPAGSIVVLFGTGEGQTAPPGVDGQIANTTFPSPALPVSVSIGGTKLDAPDILYCGAAPQQTAGLWQLNVRIPSGTPAGNQPVVVTVGTAPSLPGLTVAVK